MKITERMESDQVIVMLRLQIAILERLMFKPESFTRADERDHQFLIFDAKQLVTNPGLKAEPTRLRSSLSLIRDVCKSYEPIAAVASIRRIAEAALKDRPA